LFRLPQSFVLGIKIKNGEPMNRIIFILFFMPLISIAEVIETWTCTERYGGEILVVASVNAGRETGKIKVAGVVHETIFQTKGFERRWDFGLAHDSTYDYAFVVEPNGDASYYDFSRSKKGGIVKPSIFMKCKNK
jgi:hypothetical protein